MTDTTKIRDKMDVVCSCGTTIGEVDHMDGDRIKLTKSGPNSGGKHHWVPADWVDHVDQQQVHLAKNSEECMKEWEVEGAAA